MKPMHPDRFLRWSFLLACCLTIPQACHNGSSDPSPPAAGSVGKPDTGLVLEAEATYLGAVETIKRLTDMTGEDDATRIVRGFLALQGQPNPDLAERQRLIEEREIQKWGNQLSEFLSLGQMVFSFAEESFQKEHGAAFQKAVGQIEGLRIQVNAFVQAVHPGFAFLHAEALRARATGRGVTIAVFDTFDPDLLARQRKRYPRAQIEPLRSFHDPVSINHGNSVIDVILALAPEARIAPFAADTAAYGEALAAILARDDIDVVNMSRALLKAKEGDGLDPAFAAQLLSLVGQKILTKSLGNTGTDLDGKLTDRRVTLGLGPVGNLFAYDLALIQDLLGRLSSAPVSPDLLLLALNLTPFAGQISLTATIPGDLAPAQGHTLGTPADGIFSWSTDNFESGSSFAAPQLAALCALLLEVDRQKNPSTDPVTRRERAVRALTQGAASSPLGPTRVGLGLADGDAAASRL